MKKSYCTIILMAAFILACSSSKEEFGGLGIEVPTGEGIVSKDKPYKIVSVYAGGTGDNAGLKAGDRIVRIDGKAIDGMQFNYIVTNLLRGKVGSAILLEIDRDGQKMVFRIQRGKIVLKQ